LVEKANREVMIKYYKFMLKKEKGKNINIYKL